MAIGPELGGGRVLGFRMCLEEAGLTGLGTELHGGRRNHLSSLGLLVMRGQVPTTEHCGFWFMFIPSPQSFWRHEFPATSSPCPKDWTKPSSCWGSKQLCTLGETGRTLPILQMRKLRQRVGPPQPGLYSGAGSGFGLSGLRGSMDLGEYGLCLPLPVPVQDSGCT